MIKYSLLLSFSVRSLCQSVTLTFTFCHSYFNPLALFRSQGWDVAQAVEHSAVKVWILLYARSILHGGCICSLGYCLFQPVVDNGCAVCCPVCGKVHIKDPLLLIPKSSLCGDSRFPLKKCYNDHMLDVQ